MFRQVFSDIGPEALDRPASVHQADAAGRAMLSAMDDGANKTRTKTAVRGEHPFPVVIAGLDPGILEGHGRGPTAWMSACTGMTIAEEQG